jgi:hypothetical protein
MPCNNKVKRHNGLCSKHLKSAAAVKPNYDTNPEQSELSQGICKGSTIKGKPCKIKVRGVEYCHHHTVTTLESTNTVEEERVFNYESYIKLFKTFETKDYYQYINIPILHNIKDTFFYVGQVPPMENIQEEVYWRTCCRALRVYLTHKFDDLHKSNAVKLGRHKPTVENKKPYVPPSPEDYSCWSGKEDRGSVEQFHKLYTNNENSMNHISYISKQYCGILTDECIYLCLSGDMLLG